MRLLFVSVVLVALSQGAGAQLLAARDNPVVYGHHHINASDIDAHKKFWIDGLGGSSVTIGTSTAEVISFPNVLVFLTSREPIAGTIGSVVNHVGFETTDIHTDVARLQDIGFQMITRQELPASYTVVDGIARRDGGNTIAYVLGPDDTKVELIENTAIEHPIQMHHIHWATQEGEAMQQWYVEHFGAIPGTRIGQPAADLPGVNLTFAPSTDPVAPTRGRSIDHIGFEVENLEAFCRRLEASGITLDRGYTPVPSLGIAIAFFTDPWGTYVELTEGLDAVTLP
ncbi:MAG: VOC family protein [Pseudohongiellaceae bacterium]